MSRSFTESLKLISDCNLK